MGMSGSRRRASRPVDARRVRRAAGRPRGRTSTAMRSMVSAISARGTVTTASWMSCSSRRSAPSADAGVDRADAAGMAGAPGLQQVERFGAAHLADRDAVGPQAQRGADQIGERGDAVLGAQRHEVGRGALQLARVLDQDDAVGGLGDLGQQRIGERGLAGRGAAGDEDVLAGRNGASAARRPAMQS